MKTGRTMQTKGTIATTLIGAAAVVAAVTFALAGREPARLDAGGYPASARARPPAVALDAWAQGEVVDVLWAAPRAGGDDEGASTHAHHGGNAGAEGAKRPGDGAHGQSAGPQAHGADGYELFHARSLDGGRSFAPATQVGADWAALHAPHRGTDPQIAAAGDLVIAVWTSPGTSKWGTGPLAVAVSRDGGATWSRGGNPADDHSTDGHGFIDVAADPAGGFHAVWLDGRDGDQGLRVASSDDGVAWRANANVDAVTCQCCWNDLAVLGPGRLAVLYRDRDPRDMAVAVSDDGARSWERRGVAGAFGWKVDGCPHVGGGLAALGDDAGGDVGRAGSDAGGNAVATEVLHALVWTGAEGRVGLYDLASRDGGRSWVEPRRLGGSSARHGDLAAVGDRLVAAWDEGGAVYAAQGEAPGGRGVPGTSRQAADGSAAWEPARRLTPEGVRASHPLVVAAGGGALVLWTQNDGEEGSVTRWASARVGDR